jgi:hypothetical protein
MIKKECNTCNIRWTRSQLTMNMQPLRTIYYLIVVHYLCSGLKMIKCKYRPLSVQRKTIWRQWVSISDYDFQVHDKLCNNLRSFTFITIYHWKRLQVYFPMQLTDHDLDFCSKHYDYFSEDCSGCIVPPGPNLMMHILFQRLVISYWAFVEGLEPN